MKKKIWLTSILAAATLFGASGCALTGNNAPTNAVAETWQVAEEIDSFYIYGDDFTVPGAVVTVGGKQVGATFSVKYPNGTVTTDATFRLNQAGTYTITYYATENGVHYSEEKSFVVENRSYVVSSEQSSVSYGAYTEYGCNSMGVLARIVNKDSLTFTKLIPASELTMSNSFIEGFVTPDTQGTADFNNLIVTLTDSVDSSIFVRYEIHRYLATSGLATAFVTGGGNGQDQGGLELGKAYHVNNGVGTPLYTSFVGQTNANGWSGAAVNIVPDSKKFSLAFDYETMELYAGKTFMTDLNNAEYNSEFWSGFPSGLARLSVSATGYNSATANFCITKVHGIDLEEEFFADNEGPAITLETDSESLPLAEVGCTYPIPQATAYDKYSGACDVQISVYKNYASENPVLVTVKDGAFKPASIGYYTIVYRAVDGFGNETVKELSTHVSAKLPELTVTTPEGAVDNAELGDFVAVEQPTVVGGSGKYTVEITASLGDETYAITDGFRPEVAGKWTVTYTVTDYIGKVVTTSYEVNAVAGSIPRFIDQVVLPQIYISGSEYVLPVLYANDYSSGKLERKLASVSVEDKNGTKTYQAGDSFIPEVAENGDIVKLTYFYGEAKTETIAVPAILARSGNKVLMQNYFYGEGFSLTTVDENGKNYTRGIKVTATEKGDNAWTFANPQLKDAVALRIQGIADKASYGALTLTLTDAEDPSLSITLTASVKKGATVLTSYQDSYDVSTSLITNDTIELSYKNGKFSFGDTSISVHNTDDGAPFTGFKSQKVYVSVGMKDALAGASYFVIAVGDSVVSYRNLDAVAPSLKVLGNAGGNRSIGTQYVVERAVASDVFAPNVSLSVTVTAPDGSIVKDVDGTELNEVSASKAWTIMLEQYGQYYVNYTAKEINWGDQEAQFLVVVKINDEVAPTIRFKTSPSTQIKLGESIILPEVVVSDNLTEKENLTVITQILTASGRQYVLKGNYNAFTPAYVGEYRIVMSVMDEFGNAGSIAYVVTVTE